MMTEDYCAAVSADAVKCVAVRWQDMGSCQIRAYTTAEEDEDCSDLFHSGHGSFIPPLKCLSAVIVQAKKTPGQPNPKTNQAPRVQFYWMLLSHIFHHVCSGLQWSIYCS